MRKVGYGLGGVFALVSGVVIGSAIGDSKKKAEVRPERFSALAKKYDKEVGSTEEREGIDKLRRNLVKNASGKVLETCAGTGRNNAYYDPAKVSELILMDLSTEMLEEAIRKPFAAGLQNVKTVQAASLEGFPSSSFDTVVDTFGICSVNNPEKFLKEINRILKPGGKALFLEHGRAESDGLVARFVNAWLDFRAPSHASYFGCLWNRQVGSLIERCGLIIERKEVHHYGTCTEIEARKVV